VVNLIKFLKMFTGIVEEIGKVVSVSHGGAGCVIKIAVEKLNCNLNLKDNPVLTSSRISNSFFRGVRIGDSIAVNGVCLTVTAFDDCSFCADVMPETLRSSTLGALKCNDAVNLERALLVGNLLNDQIGMPANANVAGRLNGHIVTGHIDGTGVITSMRDEGNAVVVSVRAAAEILKYVVMKGSVALDGTSLTVCKLHGNEFSVSLIPETRRRTVLGMKRVGDSVNIECDILGKYVERFLCGSTAKCLPAIKCAASDEQNSADCCSKKVSNIDMEFLSRNGF
jgi:riboflavin synthase